MLINQQCDVPFLFVYVFFDNDGIILQVRTLSVEQPLWNVLKKDPSKPSDQNS